jgi:hypothetical protein
MIRDLRHILTRSGPSILGDCLGASALIVMVMAALHLPGLV